MTLVADRGAGVPGGIRPRDLLTAELTKIRTMPAAWLAAAGALLANTLLGLLAATDVVRLAGRDGHVAIAELGTVLLAPAYLLAVLPVLAAGNEYRGGQLRVSLAAVPERGRYFTAKLLATTAVTAVAAVCVVAPGYLVQHALADGVPAALGGILARSAGYLLLGLIGFGLAVLTRTIVTPLAVLSCAPVLVATTLGGIVPGLVRLLPHEAALSFLGMPASPELTIDPAAGLLVLVGWAVLAVGAAWTAVTRRDS
jgi:ABC-2 type transport system permease protein